MKTAYTTTDRAINWIKCNPGKSPSEVHRAIDSRQSLSQLLLNLRRNKEFSEIDECKWTEPTPPPTREFKPLDTRCIRPLIAREGALEYRQGKSIYSSPTL